MKKRLTILTKPTDLIPRVKRKYGGHQAVTRSLIEGLEKIGYQEFNYGPEQEEDIAEHVHVLAGVKTLEYAIKLKNEGKIRRLTAGPNIIVFPIEYNGIMADGNVELCLTPSQWVANLYIEMMPDLSGRCCSWPAGVDTDVWMEHTICREEKKGNKVLVYHKEESDQFCYRVCHTLRKYGFDPIIIKYGDYVLEDYKRMLAQCEFSVVISRQESQGIFMAEAWAMDVPTLCYDPHYYRWDYNGIVYERAGDITTCPYLTEETGMRWDGIKELEAVLASMDKRMKDFHPREWVMKNMSDEVCAENFLRIIGL